MNPRMDILYNTIPNNSLYIIFHERINYSSDIMSSSTVLKLAQKLRQQAILKIWLTIVAADSNEVSLGNQIHNMSIPWPRTLSLNHNATLQHSESKVKFSWKLNMRTEGVKKSILYFGSSPVPFEFFSGHIKHIKIVGWMPSRTYATLGMQHPIHQNNKINKNKNSTESIFHQ